MKLINHLKTINEHRREVRKICFRLGIYYQGLTHDLSKYSPSEFWVGVKYFQGFRSPNNAEREEKGYSEAWMHHKGRNRHHYEYWIDYSAQGGGKMVPVRMPDRYIAEMYADRVAASKIYNKEKYTDEFPLKYFLKGTGRNFIEEETSRDLEILMRMLAEKGESVTERYIRTEILKGRPGAMLAEYIANRKESK